MSDNAAVSSRLVFFIYAMVSLGFIVIGNSLLTFPLYFSLYCALSALMLYLTTVVMRKPSSTVKGIITATLFLAMAVLYSTIYDSIGIVQDGILAATCICSMYLNITVNLYMVFGTVGIYAFYALFDLNLLTTHFGSPEEIVIRTVTLLLGQIFITGLVSVIKKSQQVLLEKNKSYMELLRIVEFKKKDAVSAAKTKADFLANMSHEIRTPMNAIVGMTEMILRDNISPAVRDNAHNIKSAGNALLAIINDILDFSKIESGKMEIVEVKYQITSVLNDIINIISVRLNDKSLDLIIDIEPNIPFELYGDEIRLRQILTNLLNNAAKFTSEGYIKLSVSFIHRNGADGLSVAVTDTGSGIHQEDMNRLFESFSRFDTRQNRTIEGTGLGLSICKRLLDLMNGTISVQSEYGKGSTFSFFLPQSVVDSTPIALVKNEKLQGVLFADNVQLHIDYAKKDFVRIGVNADYALTIDELLSNSGKKYSYIFVSQTLYDYNIGRVNKFAADNGGAKIILTVDKNRTASGYNNVLVMSRPIYCSVLATVLNDEPLQSIYGDEAFKEGFTAPKAHILVVDDNAINLKVVKGLLEPYKLTVSTAQSGQQCLDLLENNRYDMIYMDHMMPGLDGIDTLHLIRERDGEYFKNVPVVALTANAISGVREMFFSVGFQDYVSKPIELTQLEKSLKNHLPPEYIIKCNSPVKAAHKADNDISIAGVDVARGLLNCGGSNANYAEVLNVVCSDSERIIGDLVRFAESRDYKNYTIQAHAMKSVCANIGALPLSEYAKAHEFAGHDEQYDFIDNGYRQLTDEYEALCAAIRAELERLGLYTVENVVEAGEDAQCLDCGMLKAGLESAMTLVESFEPDAAEEKLTKLLETKLDGDVREALNKIKKMVYDYEYDEATAALSVLISQCNGG